jgi:hypothetical protein
MLGTHKAWRTNALNGFLFSFHGCTSFAGVGAL